MGIYIFQVYLLQKESIQITIHRNINIPDLFIKNKYSKAIKKRYYVYIAKIMENYVSKKSGNIYKIPNCRNIYNNSATEKVSRSLFSTT